MAYIPPHRRHLKDVDRPIPVRDSLIPQPRESVSLRTKSASQRNKERQSLRKIVYAKDCISRWWPIGSTDDDQIPQSFHLEPFSCDPVERQRGEKPLILVDGQRPTVENEITERSPKSPWMSIPEKMQPYLLDTLQNVKKEMESGTEEFKPSFIARFGKIFFHGSPSISLDVIRNAAIAEPNSRNKMNKSFYTNVPNGYVEDIEHMIVPRIGLDFDSEKDHYHVKVLDKSRPDATISCKCTITENNEKIDMYKIELNPVRHLLIDISCLYKDLDLRLMLCNKRMMTDMDDEEKEAIKKLIDSAIIDPDVKGGLRWPLGKESVGDRFSIVGVWHTKYRTFRGRTMRLTLRHADRFDFSTYAGEVSNEATIKMTLITRWLRDGLMDADTITAMLQETVKLIWDEFLSCDHRLT